MTDIDYHKKIAEHIEEHSKTVATVINDLSADIIGLVKVMAASLANEGTVFWCGNGGSAADSQHLAAELVGRFRNNRRALRSVALTTDSSVITCVANDYSYADIFSRQVEALARPNDVLIGLSTSGQSENVLRAFTVAKSMGMTTAALLGKDGGAAIALVDKSLVVKSHSTARIQETHILIGHILCDLLERELGFV